MKLTDLETKNYASKALAENFEMKFDTSKLDKMKTMSLLQQVHGLIKESRNSKDFHKNQNSPAYLKLVFMAEALTQHYAELKQRPSARIVVENEEVEKSQVVLAAQDMVDSVQKMLEDVGQMQVKELPALVSSIESEIGVQESQTYNDQVSAQLDTLSAALKETFTGLKAALGTITGQGGGEFAPAADTGMAELPPEGGEEEVAMDTEVDAEIPEPASAEEPEADMTGAVGRAKR